MTESGAKRQKSARLPSAGQFCFLLFILFCAALILRNPEIAMEYMTSGMKLCARTVIPSLFPFMVLSELIVGGGWIRAVPPRLLAPLRALLGLPDAGILAAALGLLCGFPVGARCAVLSYEKGLLDRDGAERVIAFSSAPSSAFLISAVGVSLWESRKFGIALYATVLCCAVLTGILLRILSPAKKERLSPPARNPRPDTEKAVSGPKLFTGAIASAAQNMLLVCAYVIFFSALVGTLNLAVGALRLPAQARAFLFCVFELSGGVSAASGLGNASFAALLCAFAAGWSGLSVHCQILSVCDGTGISLRRYFWAKLLQGILCAAIFGLLLFLFPALTDAGNLYQTANPPSTPMI